MENYHKNQEYFTRSYLVNFLRSPLHALTALEQQEETAALLFGQAYHAMIAGQFDREFIVLDEANRPEKDKTMASNLNKQWKAEIEASGAKVIKSDLYSDMRAMYDQLQKNELVQRMNAFAFLQEETYKSEIDGYKVKCRPDCIVASQKLLVDWKTTADLPTSELHAERLVKKYNYHFQAAMYCEITGMDHMLFFFQEKQAPFDVVPVLIKEGSPLMKEGSDLWRKCAKKATECQKSGVYPGIAESLTEKCFIL